MAMNGIDISSYQSGINLTVVPCDFVITKATEGTGYVNPDYERAYAQAKQQANAWVFITMHLVETYRQRQTIS